MHVLGCVIGLLCVGACVALQPHHDIPFLEAMHDSRFAANLRSASEPTKKADLEGAEPLLKGIGIEEKEGLQELATEIKNGKKHAC